MRPRLPRVDLGDWIGRQGGVASRRGARDAGFRSFEGVLAVGRNWLALPNAPAPLVTAARLNGRLTCVSAAAHLGLSMLAPSVTVHVAVAHNSPVVAPDGVRLHRARPLVPVGPRMLVADVADVLAHTALCLSELEALIVWESALRKQLISRAAMAGARWPRGPQRRLAAVASDSSDSLLETIAAQRLREHGIRARQQVRLLGRRVDLLIGERLVLQLDGYEFHRDAAQRRSDIEFDARLMIEGFRVIRKDFRAIVHDWPSVIRDIREALLLGFDTVDRRTRRL